MRSTPKGRAVKCAVCPGHQTNYRRFLLMPYSSPLTQFGKTLILIGVVAGVYFVFGLLGLLLRIPADPVEILMPATGVALAATLLLGNRILLGVVIGSFCVNAWAFDFNPEFLPLYSASTIGSTLSALIGASLIRRMIGFPNPLFSTQYPTSDSNSAIAANTNVKIPVPKNTSNEITNM